MSLNAGIVSYFFDRGMISEDDYKKFMLSEDPGYIPKIDLPEESHSFGRHPEAEDLSAFMKRRFIVNKESFRFEEKIKTKLRIRGFSEETILNSRGIVSAAIDETILEVIKNQKV